MLLSQDISCWALMCVWGGGGGGGGGEKKERRRELSGKWMVGEMNGHENELTTNGDDAIARLVVKATSGFSKRKIVLAFPSDLTCEENQ